MESTKRILHKWEKVPGRIRGFNIGNLAPFYHCIKCGCLKRTVKSGSGIGFPTTVYYINEHKHSKTPPCQQPSTPAI